MACSHSYVRFVSFFSEGIAQRAISERKQISCETKIPSRKKSTKIFDNLEQKFLQDAFNHVYRFGIELVSESRSSLVNYS